VNVGEKWVKEVRKHRPSAPIVLVGTKNDTRNDQKVINNLSRQNESPLTVADGEKLAREINCAKYMECSAKENKNVQQVFKEALKHGLNPPKKKQSGPCNLL
jgi:GTPase SAR1 family protein